MNLLVCFSQLAFSELCIAARFCHFGIDGIRSFRKILTRIISVLLHIGNRPGHLLQIGNLDFLCIRAALLGFYTGLQVNHKAQIGLDEQDSNRIVYCPMRIVLLCGPCIFCKNAEKPVAVIIGTKRTGRDILLSVSRQIAESSAVVFY